MITVSDNAKEYIHEMMKTEGKAEDSLVRVGVKGGGCSGLQYEMKFDTEVKQGDQVFEDKGIKLVVEFFNFFFILSINLIVQARTLPSYCGQGPLPLHL